MSPLAASSSVVVLAALLLLLLRPGGTSAFVQRCATARRGAGIRPISAGDAEADAPSPGIAGAAASSKPVSASTKLAAASGGERSFGTFDYGSRWYPVVWARDVPPNRPTRVTLFDVDYALAKTTVKRRGGDADGKGGDDEGREEEEEVFYALVDSCPHKKVALSEGRVTDSGAPDRRYLQCSYHGWTFDGVTGQCMEIPQTMIAKQGRDDEQPTKSNQTVQKRREDAAPVAVHVAQGMVWLQPSYTPLEALAATEKGELAPPPRIPEMDMEGYRSTCAVRDFPIDWTVLMENIMDPDHGYFAHSSSGTAKGFDWYSADGVENTVSVDEEFVDGGWKITSSVNAVEKLIEYNKNVRSVPSHDGDEKKPSEGTKKDESPPPRLATTTFVAPSLIHLGRRTNSTSPSPFITGFWICPTGTGRSRFMSAAIGKTPFSVPRWLVHMNLNNFLDQDTFLLCGQHRAVLKREAEGYLGGVGGGDGAKARNDVRKSTYVYRSPSERMPVRIGQFFDATLSRAPNRREGVLSWYDRSASDGKLLETWPSRKEVLDRYEQHTRICPDSMDVVKRCDRVMKSSKAVGLALVFMKMILGSRVASSTLQASLTSNPAVSGLGLAAIGQVVSRALSFVCGLANRVAETLIRDKSFYSILAFAFVIHSIASRIRREFFFKFDDELHRKDIKFIAKNWVDL